MTKTWLEENVCDVWIVTEGRAYASHSGEPWESIYGVYQTEHMAKAEAQKCAESCKKRKNWPMSGMVYELKKESDSHWTIGGEYFVTVEEHPVQGA